MRPVACNGREEPAPAVSPFVFPAVDPAVAGTDPAPREEYICPLHALCKDSIIKELEVRGFCHLSQRITSLPEEFSLSLIPAIGKK